MRIAIETEFGIAQLIEAAEGNPMDFGSLLHGLAAAYARMDQGQRGLVLRALAWQADEEKVYAALHEWSEHLRPATETAA